MARSLSPRRTKAKNKRLNLRIKQLTEALHTVVEKGFTDPKLLAELNACKQEINPLKKYKVRLEFLITESQFAHINVEAASPKEAILMARKLYTDSDGKIDLDYWLGEITDSELDFTYDWEVEEIT